MIRNNNLNEMFYEIFGNNNEELLVMEQNNCIDIGDFINNNLVVINTTEEEDNMSNNSMNINDLQMEWNAILFQELGYADNMDITIDPYGDLDLRRNSDFDLDGELRKCSIITRDDYEVEYTKQCMEWHFNEVAQKYIGQQKFVIDDNAGVEAYCTMSGNMNSEKDWSDITMGIKDRNLEEILPPEKSFYSESKYTKNAAQYKVFVETCKLIDKYKNSEKNLCSIWTKFWNKCYSFKSDAERNTWLCPWHIKKIRIYLNSLGVGDKEERITEKDKWINEISKYTVNTAGLKQLWKSFWKMYFNKKSSGVLATWLSSVEINEIKALFNAKGVKSSQ